MEDLREIKDIDLGELIERARNGTLRGCSGGPLNELRRHRAYQLDEAQRMVKNAANEVRALAPTENATVDRLMSEARELAAKIAELDAAYRKRLGSEMHALGHQTGA